MRPGRAGQGLSGALVFGTRPLGTRVGNRTLLPFAKHVRLFAKSHAFVIFGRAARARVPPFLKELRLRRSTWRNVVTIISSRDWWAWIDRRRAPLRVHGHALNGRFPGE